MSAVFNVFPSVPAREQINYADKEYLFTKSGEKYLDFSAGVTSHMILGWNNAKVNAAMIKQMKKFTHVDYKAWRDPNCELLSQLLIDNSRHGLNKVYFCGNSGGEACEAAIKMSYQWHLEQGNSTKQWVISRDQSYHGSSSDAMSLGDRKNLEIYRDILPYKRARICEHNPIRHRRSDETLNEYTFRTTQELEDKILEIGPENVASFVGETMMGGLVGDVPPSPGYWKQIRKICDKYNVHLILDEVYCGTGTSGKYFCIDWDEVKPDFLFMGKTLAAGYAPVSVVMTSSEVEDAIRAGSGRLQHSTTHQGYSLGVAAAIAAQNIILEPGRLEYVNKLGKFMRDTLNSEFSHKPYFGEVRGRGLRFSFEYAFENNQLFSEELEKELICNHNLIISSKWHRLCFTPSLMLSKSDATLGLDSIITSFRKLEKKFI